MNITERESMPIAYNYYSMTTMRRFFIVFLPVSAMFTCFGPISGQESALAQVALSEGADRRTGSEESNQDNAGCSAVAPAGARQKIEPPPLPRTPPGGLPYSMPTVANPPVADRSASSSADCAIDGRGAAVGYGAVEKRAPPVAGSSPRDN